MRWRADALKMPNVIIIFFSFYFIIIIIIMILSWLDVLRGLCNNVLLFVTWIALVNRESVMKFLDWDQDHHQNVVDCSRAHHNIEAALKPKSYGHDNVAGSNEMRWCRWWQFVSRGSLERLIADKSHDLSWPLRIRLACDVAKGLKYVHGRGIMHRDLTSKVSAAFHQLCPPNSLCYHCRIVIVN